MNVCKAWRISNNSVGHKRLMGESIGFNTRSPTAFQHLLYHQPLPLDLSSFDRLHTRDETRVFDHVCHELRRVSSDGIELQSCTRVAYKVAKYIVSSQAHSVSMLAKFVSERNERLDISTTAYNLYHNIQLDRKYIKTGSGDRTGVWRWGLIVGFQVLRSFI